MCCKVVSDIDFVLYKFSLFHKQKYLEPKIHDWREGKTPKIR